VDEKMSKMIIFEKRWKSRWVRNL